MGAGKRSTVALALMYIELSVPTGKKKKMQYNNYLLL